ncbi:MAG: DUF6250 domain-containing protein [Winogradskyella sp.]|uniref:DUF6250 domain-containing protein n=1 Tax=Winogradskyella sp. TaxID=1883156 RepID=UPI00385B7B5B
MKIFINLTAVFIFSMLLFGCKANHNTSLTKASDKVVKGYQLDKLLFQDDFNNNLSQWTIETEPLPHTSVSIKNEKLRIDVAGGATIWLADKLNGNVLITYDRTVLIEDGVNDRLSDLNQFWMANDSENSEFFTRNGIFKQYHNLNLYYFGIGGNRNTTTRFRKYLGNGERFLITDRREPSYVLKPNHTYRITTIVYNGTTKVFVDDKEYFSYTDNAPLTNGYFGFRTVSSRQDIDNFRVYSLK